MAASIASFTTSTRRDGLSMGSTTDYSEADTFRRAAAQPLPSRSKVGGEGKYVELRTRSAFSFLEGASTPEDLADRAAELGYRAIALGDRDGVYGHPRFYQAAKEAGVK